MSGTSDTSPSAGPIGSSGADTTASILVDDVVVRRGGTTILDHVSVRVAGDERWIVLGPNGSGKTTLLRIMALYDHPTSGHVEVLGRRLGRVDIRELRRSVGYAAAALADQLRADLSAVDVVKTAKFAALEPWWHRYDDADRERAIECLTTMGVERLADRRFGTLSSGEQQRVLLARTLMNDPAVVLLDEPSARLDLGGREQLIGALADFAGDDAAPPFVMVTHHVNEIPPGVSHVAMMRDGRVVEAGPIGSSLTADTLSACFGLDLLLDHRDGRWSARAVR